MRTTTSNNKEKRIVVIVGTRPQIIKSGPVVAAFNARDDDCHCTIINTGQHYDYEMNKQFFKELKLPDPEVDLGIGQGSANEQISRIVSSLDKHLSTNPPDLAIVPGDTNSALAAGLACSKLGIGIAHLESGCRSYDFRMSEEINRRVLDHISQILLCPTSLCKENLRGEKVLAKVVEFVGDTMFDSILEFAPNIEKSKALASNDLKPNQYAFMTMHRAENVDDARNLKAILSGIAALDIPIVFSVHPRTRSRMAEFNVKLPSNVKAIDPLSYFDTLRLIRDSKFVLTDSGGVQKESYWLRRPSMILRDTTEWIEIVNAGASFLVGHSGAAIQHCYQELERVQFHPDNDDLFGDGHASRKVVETIIAAPRVYPVS
jgi:UDP-GlcNAc3NAcA epimerase